MGGIIQGDMRAAIVAYAYYSRDSRVRRYAESLAARGHRVDCLVFSEDYRPLKNITLIGFPIPRQRRGVARYIIDYTLFFFFVAWHLTWQSYDIVHINNMPEVLVLAAFVARLKGAKILLDIHDPTPELFMSKYRKNKTDIAVRLLRNLEKMSLRFADRVITANEVFRKLLLSRNPGLAKDSIDVILNCPDPRIFRPARVQKRRGEFNVLYMGTVEERLAIDLMIDALPDLVQAVPRIRFILIPKLSDEGDYFRELYRRILASPLAEHITVKQPLPLERIAAELKSADAGIVLSRKDIYTDIIFPLKLLEFVQMGVPVVAVRTKILGNSFTDRQIMFLKQPTGKALAANIILLAKDRSRRTSYAAAARVFLKEHNWPDERKKYLALIRNLTNKE